ncbi:MAG: SEC-C domain-containing protein [Pseudonocardiales bacterium]|nr:SEC-C domain-containing protein [Pseudonocardiales bacterium]
MPSTALLTSDDLDEIGSCVRNLDRPFEVVAELVDAVDQGRVADQSDAGYALLLAAEITESSGDVPAAVALAARAVEEERLHGEPEGYARAYHAQLLLQLGRQDEGMAELRELRPLLSRNPDAVYYISEALDAGGHAEIAEQWLTEALLTVLQRGADLALERSKQVASMAFTLAQVRHRVRRGLDLPHDAHDHLADLLMHAVYSGLGDDELPDEQATLLFWPRPELERLLLRWPALAEHYGQGWDDYRSTLQQALVSESESGVARLVLLAGCVDELASYAERHGGDPTDPHFHQDYAQHLTQRADEIPWPPGRNQACWCGSSLKYKKCCLLRARS